VFFDVKGAMTTERVHQEQAVVRERVGSYAHDALTVEQFLAKNRTPVLRQHPSCSPDLMWLSAGSKIEKRIKGNAFRVS